MNEPIWIKSWYVIIFITLLSFVWRAFAPSVKRASRLWLHGFPCQDYSMSSAVRQYSCLTQILHASKLKSIDTEDRIQ